MLKLTSAQRNGLLAIVKFYDQGCPLYSPEVGVGTRRLAWTVKAALVNAKLIEPFDWQTEAQERGIRGAVPPYIFYRPTAMGRERALSIADARLARACRIPEILKEAP